MTRKKKNRYAPGDLITVGSTRWLVQFTRGDEVELRATSTPEAILWCTWQELLPPKPEVTR